MTFKRYLFAKIYERAEQDNIEMMGFLLDVRAITVIANEPVNKFVKLIAPSCRELALSLIFDGRSVQEVEDILSKTISSSRWQLVFAWRNLIRQIVGAPIF